MLQMQVKAHTLIPMPHVADGQSSFDFYRRFAMEVQGSLKSPDGIIVWGVEVSAITYPP
jgi:hypothetical protein